jgi:hypothetical protein
MQFVMPVQLLGANFYDIDGKKYCSLSVMEQDPADKSLKGYRPAKITAESVVFDQLSEDIGDYPRSVDLIVMNKVSGGKLQQRCIAIKKPEKNNGASSPAAKAI